MKGAWIYILQKKIHFSLLISTISERFVFAGVQSVCKSALSLYEIRYESRLRTLGAYN